MYYHYGKCREVVLFLEVTNVLSLCIWEVVRGSISGGSHSKG